MLIANNHKIDYTIVTSLYLNRLINFDKTMYQELILVSVLLLFLMYVSIGLLKVCSLELSENGLTKTLLFSRKKYNLDFAHIYL